MLGLYNRALECATNAMVISDMRLPNQPVFYANPAFERITGYSLMETIGQNLKMLQGQDDAQPEIAVLERAQRAGESASVVIRSYRKDGSLFFNEVSIAPVKAEDGTVPHYVGVMSDVTERERSRMALAERNARLNAVFDLSPDGFVVFDREGELVYSNAAFREMTGWRAETIAQMTISEFDAAFSPMCDPALPYRPVAQALSTFNGAVATPEVIRLVQPSHRALARLVRHNVDGRGESILYLRDVTQEAEVDRMKTEFLSTAAHELRTPMVSIFGFTELLLNRPVPDGKKRDLLETIHRQSSILINMVNELLDLARIEARAGKDLKREPLQIGPMIEQTVGAIMVAGDNRKVAVDMAHGQVELSLDREKTMQALTNVLSNAFKYSPGGGEIRLTTVVGKLREMPALGIRVQDHGIGMTTAQQSRVFERFYRADPSGNIPGTGLGMSLVKEIAELQGGQVEIQSEFGKGTAVTLWFPMKAAIGSVAGASRAQSQ
jgi:PAS domain S-box-containing protein